MRPLLAVAVIVRALEESVPRQAITPRRLIIPATTSGRLSYLGDVATRTPIGAGS